MNGFEAVKAALHTPSITPSEKLVLIILAEHVDESGYCYPGIGRITCLSGLGRSTVIRAIQRLEKAGIIAIERRKKGAGNLSNRYNLSALGSVTMTLGSTTVTPPLVSPRHHPSVTVTPEQTNNKPIEQNREQSAAASESPYWKIPPTLETDDFIRSWHAWLTYVNEQRIPFTETQAVTLLAELEGWGPGRGTKAIRYSIKRGYRSVYEEKQKRSAKPTANGADAAWAKVWTGNQFVIPEDDKVREVVKRLGGMNRLRATRKQDLDWLRKEFIREYNG